VHNEVAGILTAARARVANKTEVVFENLSLLHDHLDVTFVGENTRVVQHITVHQGLTSIFFQRI